MIYRLLIILGTVMIYDLGSVLAQEKISYTTSYNTRGVDTVLQVNLSPITVVAFDRRPRFYRNLTRLKRAIIISYPIARQAEVKLLEMRQNIVHMDNEREINRYINEVEDELKELYTPILKRMSFYQGAILLKLIDRQTGETGYTLLKELKNGFSAFFWHTLARMYGANLKLKYDPRGDDMTMEQFVLQYKREHGITPIIDKTKNKQLSN